MCTKGSRPASTFIGELVLKVSINIDVLARDNAKLAILSVSDSAYGGFSCSDNAVVRFLEARAAGVLLRLS